MRGNLELTHPTFERVELMRDRKSLEPVLFPNVGRLTVRNMSRARLDELKLLRSMKFEQLQKNSPRLSNRYESSQKERDSGN